jgi:hypothetical protein
MTKLLTLKHWQLFGLMIGVMIISSFFDIATSQIAWAISMLLFVSIYFGWFWTMGMNLYPKLPPNTNLNLSRFKLFMLIPVVYIAIISLIFGGISIGTHGDSTGGYAVIIVPIHLFSMFCIFWCLAFVAKSLKAVELQRPVTFNDYAGEFFLIWFFPIGIWIIQPRINKIFDSTVGVDNNQILGHNTQ